MTSGPGSSWDGTLGGTPSHDAGGWSGGPIMGLPGNQDHGAPPTGSGSPPGGGFGDHGSAPPAGSSNVAGSNPGTVASTGGGGASPPATSGGSGNATSVSLPQNSQDAGSAATIPTSPDHNARSAQDGVSTTPRTPGTTGVGADHLGTAARDASTSPNFVAPANGVGVVIAGLAGPLSNPAGIFANVGSNGVALRVPYREPGAGTIFDDLTPWESARVIARFGVPGSDHLRVAPPAVISSIVALSDGARHDEVAVPTLDEVQGSRRAELLTNFVPFDGRSLDVAIEQYLARMDDLGAGLSRFRGMSDLIAEVMATAVALAASKVAYEMYARSRDDEVALAVAPAGLVFDADSGLLDPWSLDES